ncbi:hypothetical protein [Gayadomonas joobiniege]|uniref:hypothetical protein n=1 Tax=Gayadomonas joobiniege TaxID=1234606 RepID=UPI000379DBE6|nr:hypothetical protein [Gayadomonas joobiniege]
MATKSDVKIEIGDWVNINTLSGIPAGTNFRITNKGDHRVDICEAPVKPNPLDKIGDPITDINGPLPIIFVENYTDPIWVKNKGTKPVYLSVQEL